MTFEKAVANCLTQLCDVGKHNSQAIKNIVKANKLLIEEFKKLMKRVEELEEKQ